MCCKLQIFKDVHFLLQSAVLHLHAVGFMLLEKSILFIFLSPPLSLTVWQETYAAAISCIWSCIEHLTSIQTQICTQPSAKPKIHDPTSICPSFLPSVHSLDRAQKACMRVTSIQTAADAFRWRAFKAGCWSVYEGTGHAGLGLSSPAVTKLWAQSQKAGLSRRLWCI